MKKFLFVIFFVTLLLSLSLFTFAYSNSYTFSNMWNKLAFSRSYIIAEDTNYPADTISASIVELATGSDSTTIGYNDSTAFSGIKFDDVRSSAFDVSIPMGLYVNEYSNFKYRLYLLLPGDYNVTLSSVAVLTNSSTVNLTSNLTKYDSGTLYNQVLNSFGTVESLSTVYEARSVYAVDLSVNFSNDYNIDYITVSFTLNSSAGSFVLGAVGSTDIVSIPDSVDSYLATLSNKISLTNSRILTLINELRSTNTKIDDILDALASSAAGTTVLTQFLQTPSAEQQEVTEQLEDLLEEAQEELSAVKDVLESVQTPTYNDILSSNSSATQDTIDLLNRSDISDITDSVFDSFIYLTPILLGVLSIATVGYILFGKRG